MRVLKLEKYDVGVDPNKHKIIRIDKYHKYQNCLGFNCKVFMNQKPVFEFIKNQDQGENLRDNNSEWQLSRGHPIDITDAIHGKRLE